MHPVLRALAVAAAMAVAAVASGTGARAESDAARVAIVDVQRLLSEADAMQRVDDQIKELQRSFQAEITRLEQEFRAKEEELQTQRSVLAPEALAQRQRELVEAFREIEQLADKRRRQLANAKVAAVDKFNETLIDVVSDIAKERGYDMVLVKAQVVYVAGDFEITDAALERINERIPMLKVELPAN